MSEFKWDEATVKEFIHFAIAPCTREEMFQFMETFKASQQHKQEWEILEGEVCGKPHLWVESCAREPKCRIYSVKRLSDGEVFTVGDGVDIFNCLARHTISEFKIDDRNKMLAKFDDFPSYDIMLLRRKYSNSYSDKPIPVYLTPAEIEKLRTILATH